MSKNTHLILAQIANIALFPYVLSLYLIKHISVFIMSIPYLLYRIFFPKRKYGSHPISRVFRKVFENKLTKRVVGVHLVTALLFIAAMQYQVIAISLPENESSPEFNPSIQVSSNMISIKTEMKTESTFQQPVVGYLSQGFGWYHPGIDIAGNDGQAVRPIASGQVVFIEFASFGYGNSIIVDHGDGMLSRYAHLASCEVTLNQSVSHETILGRVGNTGFTTGPHLHFEVYQDYRPQNPIAYLDKPYNSEYINLADVQHAKPLLPQSQAASNYHPAIATMSAMVYSEELSKEVTVSARIIETVDGFVEPFAYQSATPSAELTGEILPDQP